jgi:hypothetical protein
MAHVLARSRLPCWRLARGCRCERRCVHTGAFELRSRRRCQRAFPGGPAPDRQRSKRPNGVRAPRWHPKIDLLPCARPVSRRGLDRRAVGGPGSGWLGRVPRSRDAVGSVDALRVHRRDKEGAADREPMARSTQEFAWISERRLVAGSSSCRWGRGGRTTRWSFAPSRRLSSETRSDLSRCQENPPLALID